MKRIITLSIILCAFAVCYQWLYNEYIKHWLLPESFENLKAANNLVDLLLMKAK